MPEEAEPRGLASGRFVDADDSHQGSGTATIYELEDGSRVLRFEEFEVTNGPDLHVFLIPEDGDMEGYVDLGSLKGNIGNQNYEITDPTFNIDNYIEGSVVLYDARYELIFSFAPLAVPEPIPGT